MYLVLSMLLGLCLGSIFYIIVKKDLADKTKHKAIPIILSMGTMGIVGAYKQCRLPTQSLIQVMST